MTDHLFVNELQVRQALLSQGEILSLKDLGSRNRFIKVTKLEQKCLKVFCNRWYLQILEMRY